MHWGPNIFIFTWDRCETITTPQFFDASGIGYRLLVHNGHHAEQYVKHGRINPGYIEITNKPKGLVYNRNYALNHMEMGQWGLFFVDDFKDLTELDDYETFPSDLLPVDVTNSTIWGKKLRKPIDAETFLARCEECINKAENEGINLVGFACYNNPLFRNQKWKYNSLADGRCLLVKKTNLRFDENVQTIDDYCWTAQNLKEFGGVLVNQWILPNCERYTAGAFGTMEDRMEQKIKDCAYLVKTYPDYVHYASKKGWPEGSHVAIVHHDKDWYKNKQLTSKNSLF